MPGAGPDGRSRPRRRDRPLLLTGTAVATVTVAPASRWPRLPDRRGSRCLGGPAGIAQRGYVGARATVGTPRAACAR